MTRAYIPGCTRVRPRCRADGQEEHVRTLARPTTPAGHRRIVASAIRTPRIPRKGAPSMTFTLTRSRAPETPPLAPNVAARAVDAVKVYGRGDTEVRALDGVTVDFASGRFTAIMGPSGSGKSTLMHCVAGLDDLTSGQVTIGGTALAGLSDKDLTEVRRDNVGFVFQSFNLIPTLNALENITLPLDLAGRKPDQAWLDQVITTVGLGNRLNHRPSELSGGQQQRVAVARALAAQ